MQALDATLQGAGFCARLSTDIVQDMWEKWGMLASLGAINCLMRGAIGEIVAVPGGADLALKMLDECRLAFRITIFLSRRVAVFGGASLRGH